MWQSDRGNLHSGSGPGDRNGQGVDGESPDDEEGENGFGEHDDMERREENRITTAPGLKFGRYRREELGWAAQRLRKS